MPYFHNLSVYKFQTRGDVLKRKSWDSVAGDLGLQAESITKLALDQEEECDEY